MPIVPFIPAIIGAGVGLYGASQQKKAADQSLAAQTAANDKSLEAQRHALDVSVGVNQPFLTGGTGAFDALLQEYGLPSSNGTPARQPAQPQQSTYSGSPSKATGGNAGTSPLQTAGANDPYYLPDGSLSNGQPGAQGGAQAPSYNAYLQANPDLAAEAQRVTADGEFPSVEAYLKYHDQQSPNEGRPSQPDPVQQGPQTPAQPAAPTPANPTTDLINAQRPDAGTAPTFTRPDGGTAPTYTRPTDQAQPTFADAPQFSNYFNGNNFTQDPSYQFRLKQGLDSANTGFAARGLLKSGAAARGITDYASNLASQEYGNAFSRAQSLYNNDLSQYNTNRNFQENNYQYGQNRADTNFGQDRSYGTNLFLDQQQRTDNNFNTDRGVGLTQYNADRARTDTNFNNDRNFQANRYDTRIGNLFDLAHMGTTAAANVSGATQANANNQTSIYGSQANAAANAANSRASANASGVGALGAAAGNVFATYGGGRAGGGGDPYSDYSFYKGPI